MLPQMKNLIVQLTPQCIDFQQSLLAQYFSTQTMQQNIKIICRGPVSYVDIQNHSKQIYRTRTIISRYIQEETSGLLLSLLIWAVLHQPTNESLLSFTSINRFKNQNKTLFPSVSKCEVLLTLTFFPHLLLGLPSICGELQRSSQSCHFTHTPSSSSPRP